MESTKVNLITILRDRVGELCEQGNFSEALYVANTAVEKAEKELNTDLESIATFASALEVRGDLFRQTGEWEKARADYRQTIDQLGNRIEDATELGRLHAYLGACHDQLYHLDRAIHHWDLAISYFEKAFAQKSGLSLGFSPFSVDDYREAFSEAQLLKLLLDDDE